MSSLQEPPAPRRTYGRVRHVSEDEDTPAANTLVFGDLKAPTSASEQPTASPRKSLLDRFASAETSFLDGVTRMKDLDQDVSPDYEEDTTDDDAEPTKEELEAVVAQMKREAHGDLPYKAGSKPPSPAKRLTASTGALASRALVDMGSSSTLSPAPSSTPPKVSDAIGKSSSPPPGPSPAISDVSSSTPLEEETVIPVVSGRRRRIITDDEDETPLHADRVPASLDDDEEDNVTDNDDTPRAAPPTAAKEQDLLADPFGIFSDDEESLSPSRPAKSSKKGLNKKDMEEMQRDIARARREKQVEVSRPEVKHKPLSSWFTKANLIASAAVASGSAASAPMPRTSPTTAGTPDDIAQFTPSSGPGAKQPHRRGHGRSSSPTPQDASHTRALIPSTSEMFEDDDGGIDLEAFLDHSSAVADRRARLAAAKKAALASKRAAVEDDELDFTVEPAGPSRPAPRPAPPQLPMGRNVPDPRAVLNRPPAPAATKTRQTWMRMAGPRSKQQTLTETYLDFAGGQFAHAGLRHASGGARPAGMKANRDVAISQGQVEASMKKKHQEQVRQLAAKKEQLYGRGRKLPEKVTPDFEALAAAQEEDSAERSDEEEDSDDAEYNPAYSGDEEENDENENDENENDENDENVPFPPSVIQDTLEEETEESDGDKENQPPLPETEPDDDAEDDNPFRVRRVGRARPSRRVAFDSDDEDEAEPVHDTSLRAAVEGKTDTSATPRSAPVRGRMPVPLAETTAEDSANAGGADDLGFDFAGFGSESGSGGFSQLFGATQAGDAEAEAETDGFAALREAPQGLLPAHALLPEVNISESQARRDNALIAAEIEAVAAAEPVEEKETRQYLNSQGFFTQTRPVGRPATPSHATQLTPRVDATIATTHLSSTQRHLSSTQVGSTSPKHPSTPAEGSSSTGVVDLGSPEPELTRLRRRGSPSSEGKDASSSREHSPSPTKSTSRKNAFDLLKSGAQRVEARAARAAARRANGMIDEQAEESDEDSGWGFLAGEAEDDDDDNDEGYIPELLDDKEMTEEERKHNEELAKAKRREIEETDDARREAEAKKVAEGYYRTKKRGNDFLSDEESDGEGGRRKRWSKKQRRMRRLDREDGLYKLGDEANVFLTAYEEGLDSDIEIEEALASPGPTPEKPLARSTREAWDLLRDRARMNRMVGMELDDELEITTDDVGFSIARHRTLTVTDMAAPDDDPGTATASGRPRLARAATSLRSVAAYERFVADEAGARRGGTAVSVVVQERRGVGRSASTSAVTSGSGGASGSGNGRGGNGAGAGPSRPNALRSGSSILLDRGRRFG